MTPEHEEVETFKALMGEAFAGDAQPFRPCAYFDEPLDCIRVLIRDCSSTEKRVDGLLTVIEDNYPSDQSKKYVGFTIKGARHFCQRNAIPLDAPVEITKILDVILASAPQPAVRWVVELLARPMVKEEQIAPVSLTQAQAH